MPGSARKRNQETWRAYRVTRELSQYLRQTAPRDRRRAVTPERSEPVLNDRDGRDLWDYLGDFA
jgi:hypothetical protein